MRVSSGLACALAGLLFAGTACTSRATTEARGTEGGGSPGAGGGAPASTSGLADAGSTAASGPELPCGRDEKGPECELGSPCAPDRFPDSCLVDATLHCQAYDRADCAPLATPRCEQGGTWDCGMSGQPRACSCRGIVMAADCASASYGIAPDPAFCDEDATFACGATVCRSWLEVCFQSVDGGPDGECVAADEAGCSAYGIADCTCIRLEPQQVCDDAEVEAIRIVTARGAL